MGTFAETANVDDRLSLSDQGKQISVFLEYIYIETAAYIRIYIVCRLSVCLRGNKRKSSVCKQTKWPIQSKRTCPSIVYRIQV